MSSSNKLYFSPILMLLLFVNAAEGAAAQSDDLHSLGLPPLSRSIPSPAIVRSYFNESYEGSQARQSSNLPRPSMLRAAYSGSQSYSTPASPMPAYSTSAYSAPRGQVMSFSAPVLPAMDSECSQMSNAVEAEHQAAVQSRKALVQRQLDFSADQLRSDIASVPKYFYDTKGHKVSNPDYKSTVDGLNSAYTIKVEAIAREADRNSSELNEYYAKRISGILSSKENLRDQMRVPSGNVKVVERGTNLFVHNYMNFGGSTGRTAEIARPSSVLTQQTSSTSLPQPLLAVTKKLNQQNNNTRR